MRLQPHQTVLRQLKQRLAHQRARHAKVVGQLCSASLVPGCRRCSTMARVRRAAMRLVVELSMRRMISGKRCFVYSFSGRLARSVPRRAGGKSVLPESLQTRAPALLSGGVGVNGVDVRRGVWCGLPAPVPGGHCAGSGPRPIRPASRCRGHPAPVHGDLAVVGAQGAAPSLLRSCARPSAATGHRHRRPGGCLCSHAVPGRWATGVPRRPGRRVLRTAGAGWRNAACNHAGVGAARQADAIRQTHRRLAVVGSTESCSCTCIQWCWRTKI